MRRVVGVTSGTNAKAYPYPKLLNKGVIHDKVGEREIVIFYKRGNASAADTAVISQGRDVGSTGVFEPYVNGMRLDFVTSNNTIRDIQTNSTWTVLGKAISGPLKNTLLKPIVHGDTFWFSWAAFYPNTTIY